MDQTGTIAALSGRYQLEQRIGAGGAGEVWRAHDRALARRVAVKVLHPSLQHDEPTVVRFKREAAAAAALNHPNVVVIYDVGHADGRDFLVMEHVDGAPLSEVLRDAPLDAGLVAALGAQVADALAAAHDLGMIHRDIKPANVILSRDGVAKVADFGIAKAVGDAQTRLTATGTVVGSAAYVAPEQLRDGDVDGRVDIYALGLLLYELLTGQRPFGRGTVVEVAARRLTDDPPAPSTIRPDIPAELDDIIVRATHLEPAARFVNAAAMADALRALQPEDGHSQLGKLAAAAAPADPVVTVVLPQDDRYGQTALDASATVPLGAALAPSVGTTPTPPPDPAPAQPSRAEATRAQAPRAEAAPRAVRTADRTRLIAGGVLLLAVLAVLGLSSGTDDDPGDAPAAGPHPIVAAKDFDPFGGGSEHARDVPLAHDGDPATAWETERYNRPNMGGLKPGTGIWFDLGEPVAVGTVDLTLGAVVDLQVFAGTEAPAGDPNTWGTLVGAAADANGSLALAVPGDLRARYFLVWITKVPQGRGAVSEVAFTRR